MSYCDLCGVDHDAEDARAEAADEARTLRERAERAERHAEALAGAIHRTRIALGGCLIEPPCGSCAWCNAGRALAAYQGEGRPVSGEGSTVQPIGKLGSNSGEGRP